MKHKQTKNEKTKKQKNKNKHRQKKQKNKTFCASASRFLAISISSTNVAWMRSRTASRMYCPAMLCMNLRGRKEQREKESEKREGEGGKKVRYGKSLVKLFTYALDVLTSNGSMNEKISSPAPTSSQSCILLWKKTL
jgi:hypothetical protein